MTCDSFSLYLCFQLALKVINTLHAEQRLHIYMPVFSLGLFFCLIWSLTLALRIPSSTVSLPTRQSNIELIAFTNTIPSYIFFSVIHQEKQKNKIRKKERDLIYISVYMLIIISWYFSKKRKSRVFSSFFFFFCYLTIEYKKS